jgi:hypothetical protein
LPRNKSSQVSGRAENENGVHDICTPFSFAKFDSRLALFRLRSFYVLIGRGNFPQRLHEQGSKASEAGKKEIHQVRSALGDRLAIASAVVAAAPPILATFVVPSIAALATAAVIATAVVAAMVTVTVKCESQDARHNVAENAVAEDTAASNLPRCRILSDRNRR